MNAPPVLRLDHHRQSRTGLAEAVYAPGKTPDQCADAVRGLLAGEHTGPVLLTRADADQAAAAKAAVPGGQAVTTAGGQLLTWRPAARRRSALCVVTAGTADLPVAAETTAVLHAYGHHAEPIYDVGVAGLHRVLAVADRLRDADLVVVHAGMEGALPSVVAGLTPAPIIAVPTSVGYGVGLDGVTALLAMHASCSPGITVVGIDNGFGAACAALRILHTPDRSRPA